MGRPEPRWSRAAKRGEVAQPKANPWLHYDFRFSLHECALTQVPCTQGFSNYLRQQIA